MSHAGTLTERRFRWLPVHGERHAVVVAEETGSTLCGNEVAAGERRRRVTYVEWCWPECAACDREWRMLDGIRQRRDVR